VRKASKRTQKLLKVSPNNARLQFDLAGLYEGAGDLAKAQEHFVKARRPGSKHVEADAVADSDQARRSEGVVPALNNAAEPVDSAQERRSAANVLQAIGVAYKLMASRPDALKQYRSRWRSSGRSGSGVAWPSACRKSPRYRR